MKKILAFLTSVTLLLSVMLPISVYAKTTTEKTHVSGETTTITVQQLFSRWKSEDYGMDGNISRNGSAYTAYVGSQNASTNGSVEENYATVSFPEDGYYTFTYVAHKKGWATVNLMLDDTVIGKQAKDDEEGAGVNIAEEFGTSVTAAWFGPTGYASPREYTVTVPVTAGSHRVGYDVAPASDGRIILFIGNIDIEGPVIPDFPDISAEGETLIEAESMVDTKYGDGTSTWENLQNKMMFYEGAAASGNFFVGTNGDNYFWGEPSDTSFKLHQVREVLQDGWYDFSYVVSSQKMEGSVSKVNIVLHPLNGGEDIVVGTNDYPEDGIPDGKKVESVTFTNTNQGTTFINNYCGIYKYNTTVYLTAGNYDIEILPTETGDEKYKFYADYIKVAPGEEPKPDYPDISAVKETVIEAESMVDTKHGDGTSTWENLQNKMMFYEGEAASGKFFVGTNGDNYFWGEPSDTNFKLHQVREVLQDGWYDFSYVVSSQKSPGSVSKVNIVLHPLNGGEDIVVGTNDYPEDGIPDGKKVESVTFTNTNQGTTFINNYCGIYKYNTTVYLTAGNYDVEILPLITGDEKYKFYADYIKVAPGEEPKPDYPDISAVKETVIEAESMVDTKHGDGTSTWANLQNKIMFYEGAAASGNFFVGTDGDKYFWGEPSDTNFKLHQMREVLQDGWYDFSYVVSSQKSHGSVSEVSIVLHPEDGSEDIVVGTNAYPEGGVAYGTKVENVTFTNTNQGTTFINNYCGIYKYNTTVYLTAGNYDVEILPTITGDEKYKFYADYIKIAPGDEPEADYPDISMVSETVIEAESIVDTKYGDGTSTWANLENKIMFYEGAAASGNFYVGTSGDNYTWGEPDETHFRLHETREFLVDGWYDFSYVVSSKKGNNSVSTLNVVLHPLDGGSDIIVGTNAYPKDGIPDGKKVEAVTFTDASAAFMNQFMGVFKYNTTVYVPAGNYDIEFLPQVASDNKYKFYADCVKIKPGEEPVVEVPDDMAYADVIEMTIDVTAYYTEPVYGEFVCAAYAGGKMVGIASVNDFDITTLEITVPYEGMDAVPDTVKIFVLEELGNARPLTQMKTIPVN